MISVSRLFQTLHDQRNLIVYQKDNNLASLHYPHPLQFSNNWTKNSGIPDEVKFCPVKLLRTPARTSVPEEQGRGGLGSERVCNSLKNPTTMSRNFLKTQHVETAIWERQKHFCCSDGSRAKWPLSFVNGMMEQPGLTRAGEKVETRSRNQWLLWAPGILDFHQSQHTWLSHIELWLKVILQKK